MAFGSKREGRDEPVQGPEMEKFGCRIRARDNSGSSLGPRLSDAA